MSNLFRNPAVHLPVGVKFVGSGAGAVEDAYPLTPMQQAMLLHGQHDPGLYVQQYVCTLREPLHVQEFRAAWQRMTDRHPVLRSSFHLGASPEPIQVVHPEVEVPWSEHDWRGLGEGAREGAMRSFLREDRALPFRPEEAPLSRFALFRLGDEAYQLVWTSHHALIDGRSRRILLREVFEDYEARLAGRDFTPGPRPPFGEYVRWQQGAERADSRAFWEEELRGFESANELVKEAGGGRADERERHRTELSAELSPDSSAWRSAARPPSTPCCRAPGRLVSRYTGDHDVVFGATRMCRRGGFAGSEEVVGLLTNTVPVRVRLDMAKPVADYLDDVRGPVGAHAPARADAPGPHPGVARRPRWGAALPIGVRLRGGERAGRAAPPGRSVAEPRLRPAAVDQLPAGGGGARRRPHLPGDGVRPRPLSREAILRMEGHLAAILRAFAEDAGQPLGKVEILTAAERRHLVDALNPAPSSAEHAPVHALLRAQAERTPDGIAVVLAGESLAYGELERRSNQLARLLQARGVGPESRVGVCMERSLEMVIALAGILKAGGAYVPLDPENPRDRLAFVLDDADVSLVLCDAPLAGRLPEGGPARVIADRLWAQAAGESAGPVDAGVEPHGLAYVMYTSGSTGRPRGSRSSTAASCGSFAGRATPASAWTR
jgi:hypothetical protein